MTHLWKHQVEAIQYALDRRDCLWHVGMGCGKTRAALEVIRAMLAEHPNGRFLVGCPKAVIAAWQKQVGLWLPHVRILALDKGTAKQKEAQVLAALCDTSPLIVVGNYETIRLMPSLEKVKWAMLVWDEVHRLKSMSGAASKWAAKMCKLNPQAKRLGMSGTLLPHALAADCPVLTPSGWTPIGKIQVGDEVIGSDGRPTAVTGVWPQGMKQMYRVGFSDGCDIECTADHLWSVTSRGRESRGTGSLLLRTDELDKPRPKPKSNKDSGLSWSRVLDSNGAPRWAIPIMGRAEFSRDDELPIHPYVLGVLLGDGHLGRPIDITTPDSEIIDTISQMLPDGYSPRMATGTKDLVAKRYRITSGVRGGSEKGPNRGPRKNPVSLALKSLGLLGKTGHHKFIPEQYLFSSQENRLALLQGLCDTDGSCRVTCATYTTVSKQLADGVRFLAQSLGGYVAMGFEEPHLTKLPQGTTCMSSLKYVLTIRMQDCPFRLSRKSKAWAPATKHKARRGIISVAKATEKEAVCITVDAKDGLYVAEHCIVTHNSPMDAGGVWRAVESPECPTWGNTKTLFVHRYFQPHPHIRGAVLGLRRDMQAEFARRVAATTFHRRSEDVLDLPPLMLEDVLVEMGSTEARLYREVEREFCAVCESGTITPKNAMEAVLRLQQICGGYAKFDDSLVATQLESTPSKQSALEERLDELERDERAVVFCRFRSDLDSARAAGEKVGRSVSELSGRMDDLAAWQSGRTSLLVAQIQSGGVGVDMSMCAYGFFYSLGYSLAEYLQAIARLHRPGQTKTTHLYHLIATLPGYRKTVDGRIYQLLSERKEVIDGIISEYKGHARQHAGADRGD